MSTYFANFTFAPYCFVSTLNSASSGSLGLGCLSLRKVIFMYPGIAIFTICLLYSYYKFNPQYILHSQSMVILQYCLNTPTRYVTRYFPTYFTPKLSTVLKHVTGIVPFFHRPGVSSQGKCLFFESLFMISLFIITPTCGNQYISHRISHTMKPFSLYP